MEKTVEKSMEAFEFLKEKLFNESLFSLSKEKLCSFVLQAFLISEGYARVDDINGHRVVFIEPGYEFSQDFLKLSAKLGIKPSKLESIVNQINMQAIFESQKEKEYVSNVIFYSQKTIEIRSKSKNDFELVLLIGDKMAKDIIERTLKKLNKAYDYSFNKDILVLSQEGLKVIMNEFLSEKDFEELSKKVKDKITSTQKEEVIDSFVDMFFNRFSGQSITRFVKSLIDLFMEDIS